MWDGKAACRTNYRISLLLQLVACKMGRVPKSSSCQAKMRNDEQSFDNTFAMDVNAVNMKQYS